MKSLQRGLMLGAVCGLFLIVSSRGYALGKVQGFEVGDPTVTKTGDASVQTTYKGVAPQEGSNQFLITTIASGDGDGLTPVSGTDAVLNSALQTFFFGTTLTGTEGSGFLTSFTVAPGDTSLTFRYDFLTNESPAPFHNDFAFALLFNSSNTLIGGVRTIITATTAQPGLSLLSDQSGPFQFHTGYTTFAISLVGLTPGTYTLGIGIEDRTTSDIPSGLLVDNITIVPEPSTVGLGIAGAVLLVALRRRLKKVS
jgi:hypothetical protein